MFEKGSSEELEQIKKTTSILDISENMSKKQRDDEKIETSQEEVDGFLQVIEALKGTIEKNRIIWRDVESYFSILLDDNNRKPICRLYFNTSQKYIALLDDEKKKEEKIPIKEIVEIRNFTVRLINTVKKYDNLD
jgi:hypothetical protein